ncbi:MAG: GGDEF domain-containing protein [Solirubrobacteraceae bacterium]
MISVGSVAAALLMSAPWQGWPYVALVVPVALAFALVDVLIRHTRYPERVSAGAMLLALAVLSVGVGLDGGSRSAALPWLVLPVASSAVRFRPRVVAAGVVLTVMAILAATFGVDTTTALNEPVRVFAALGLLASLISIVWAIQAAELHHREASVLDPLTALLNRSSLLPRFAEIVQQARVTKRPVCVLMCDIDTFKDINDTYGHDRGDAVLQEVAYQLRKQLRSFELIYRLGGEEFLVVLPGVGLRRGTEIAERLCTSVAQTKAAGVHITISIGVSAAIGDEIAFEPLFKTADAALYEAKRSGGNAVVANRAEPVIARSEPAAA